VSGLASLHRTLEQELLAVLRGASLECLVCGEFVLHEGALVRCPECGMQLHGRLAGAGSATDAAGRQTG
jgi:Zn finger protein HypA/HybF involved in hydrogenase expression